MRWNMPHRYARMKFIRGERKAIYVSSYYDTNGNRIADYSSSNKGWMKSIKSAMHRSKKGLITSKYHYKKKKR